MRLSDRPREPTWKLINLTWLHTSHSLCVLTLECFMCRQTAALVCHIFSIHRSVISPNCLSVVLCYPPGGFRRLLSTQHIAQRRCQACIFSHEEINEFQMGANFLHTSELRLTLCSVCVLGLPREDWETTWYTKRCCNRPSRDTESESNKMQMIQTI